MAISDRDAILPLTPADIAGAQALVADAGWNQVEADWRIFLDFGAGYVVRDGARVIATAATLPYTGFAWISMVLVAQDHRRRGLATRLMRRAIDDLLTRGLTPILDATPAGREVYRGLGFEDGWSYQRYACEPLTPAAKCAGDAPAEVAASPITDADWAELCAYDATAFGSDRAAVLSRLRRRLPRVALIGRRGRRIAGYVLGREGRAASQVGPLVADDEKTALALLAAALARCEGAVYVDLADAKGAAGEWLLARGFASQRPLTRMALHRRERFDDAKWIWAVAGPELG